MSLRTFLKPFSFLPALMLMYMIYSFSAQEGDVSSDLSYKVSYYMVKAADQVLDADLQEWEIESFANRFHGVTRKLAHMAEYFALAIAVSFPLYVYGLHGLPLMLAAGMICVAYACGDEYHQSFVAGRSPSKKDVLIDSFGVFWGIILVRIIGWTGRMTIFRPLRKKKRRMASEDEYSYEMDMYDQAYPEDEIPPSVYPPPAPEYTGKRVSSYYNTVQQQSGTRTPRNYNTRDQQSVRSPRPRGMTQQQMPDESSRYGNSRGRASRRPAYPQTPYPRDYEETIRGSDKLSEDLSLKKLVHDIREQRQQDHSQKDKS